VPRRSVAYGAEVERGVRSRTGSIGGLTGMLRHPAADLMIPGAAGASFPRIGPRPQSLRLSVIHLEETFGTRPNARLYEYVMPFGITAVSQFTNLPIYHCAHTLQSYRCCGSNVVAMQLYASQIPHRGIRRSPCFRSTRSVPPESIHPHRTLTTLPGAHSNADNELRTQPPAPPRRPTTPLPSTVPQTVGHTTWPCR
jgi:hypothetical protein